MSLLHVIPVVKCGCFKLVHINRRRRSSSSYSGEFLFIDNGIRYSNSIEYAISFLYVIIITSTIIRINVNGPYKRLQSAALLTTAADVASPQSGRIIYWATGFEKCNFSIFFFKKSIKKIILKDSDHDGTKQFTERLLRNRNWYFVMQ